MIKRFGTYLRRHHVALLALFFALGGTTFAASTALPRNSVGSKQLKNNAVINSKIKANAVTGAKVKDDSLTGADVLESSLGKVPSASSADRAASADSATNATNATNAGNAGTVGGLAASSIARIASTELTGDHYVGAGAATDMTSVTLNVPVRSNVLVTASGYLISSSSAACPCVLQTHLRTTGETASLGTAPTFRQDTNIGEDAAAYISGFDRVPFSVSRVFTSDPGGNTYYLTLVKQTGGTTTVGTGEVTLHAQVIPFNGDGTPASPAGGPRSTAPAASAH